MRRMRTGTIISSVGFGAVIAFLVVGTIVGNNGWFLLAGLNVITFLIGLGIIINGSFFTIPKKMLSDKSSNAISQRELDANTSDLVLPESNDIFSSVTEHTTRQLSKTQNTLQD